MLISHSKQFILIHNCKAGGTSLKKALYKYAPLYRRIKYNKYLGAVVKRIKWDRILHAIGSLTGNYKLKQVPKHARAVKTKNQLPEEIFNNYFKFVFVRNPWAWQVSLYFHMSKNKAHFQHDLIKQFDSFEEYIEWRVNEDKHLQKEYIYDENNESIVDYVGKLENIQKDLQKICQKIGMPTPEVPQKNTTNHKHYSSYYNERTKNLIAEHFSEDIELFDNEFEGK